MGYAIDRIVLFLVADYAEAQIITGPDGKIRERRAERLEGLSAQEAEGAQRALDDIDERALCEVLREIERGYREEGVVAGILWSWTRDNPLPGIWRRAHIVFSVKEVSCANPDSEQMP